MKKSWSKKQKILAVVGVLLLAAAPPLWYWLFGWGTIDVIDFSAEEVAYAQVSCSHHKEIGTVYDPGEIQALIDEANGMQNKGSTVKKLTRGIFMGGAVLYDYDFYLKDGTAFYLTFCSSQADTPVSDKKLSYWYQVSTSEDRVYGTMCQGSMEVYFQLFEKYNHFPPPG